MSPVEIDLPHAAQGFEAPLAGQPFALGLHAGHPRLAHLDFLADGIVRLRVARHYPTAGMRANLTARASAMRPLFARVRRHAPGLVGSCPLWLGDSPETCALAFCGTSTAHVLIPDPDFVGSDGYRDQRDASAQHGIPWAQRADTVFWRGSLTGNSAHHPVADWRDIPRVALCLHARRSSCAALFDVALTGDHVQVRDRGWIEAIRGAGLFGPRTPLLDNLRSRYLVDVDGNSASWSGLFTKLLAGGTVLKVESRHGFRQWYYDALQPWTHVVPVSADLGDLDAVVAWLRANPARAEAIGRAGQDLARSITTEQAFAATVPRIAAFLAANPPSGDTLPSA